MLLANEVMHARGYGREKEDARAYMCVRRFVFFNIWIMLNILVGILVEAYLSVRARDSLCGLSAGPNSACE